MESTADNDRPATAPIPRLDDGVRGIAETLRRVVVPTDASDAALGRTREVALHLAREFGFDVVLYDRSDERWTDTPHASGPLELDEIDGDRRPHLVRQLRDFEAGGVKATAWLATVPALTALIDVIQELDVDGVLLPRQLDEPKMMDRLQIGSDTASMVERVVELQLPNPPSILVVDESGAVELAGSSES